MAETIEQQPAPHAAESHGRAKHSAPHAPHEEPHEGAPEWLISFADNVALIMGFFVMLLAINMHTAAKEASGAGKEKTEGNTQEVSTAWLDAVLAIREAFHNPPALNSKRPDEQALLRRMRARLGKGPGGDTDPGRGEEQTLDAQAHAAPGQIVYFDGGAAALDEAGRQAVQRISQRLRGLYYVVEIRGHASAAEAFERPDRGMRLAYERAEAVAQALAEQGVNWQQMRLLTAADGDRATPLAYDPASQRQNQRVEVVITENVLPAADRLDAGASEGPKP